MELSALLDKRTRIQQAMASIGPMRTGSLSIRYQQCGKKQCVCKTKGHPGHGPTYSYSIPDPVTRKSIIRSYPLGSKLEKLKGELENYSKFKELMKEYLKVNNEICAATESELVPGQPTKAVKKKSLNK